MDDRGAGQGPQLPDFSAGGGSDGSRPERGGGTPERGGALPDFTGGPPAHSGDPAGSGSEPPSSLPGPTGEDGAGSGRGPLLALLLGGGGCLVVILAVIALVLSQTVFSGGGEDPADDPTTSATDPSGGSDPSDGGDASDGGGASDGGSGGSAPTDEEPATEAAASGTACTTHEGGAVTEQVDGKVRGGGLEFPQPEGWEVGTGWGNQSAYVTDQHHADQPVEAGWYTLAGVGKVEFPEEEGGYPGAEEAARAIFLCALEPEQGGELYGDPAMLRNYRDEATMIDGHDAWIVSADVVISDLALLHSTDAWRRVVIVVDTPDGPAAFDGGAALGHDQQVADLETMLEGLTVL